MATESSTPREQTIRQWKTFLSPRNCQVAFGLALALVLLWVASSLQRLSRDLGKFNSAVSALPSRIVVHPPDAPKPAPPVESKPVESPAQKDADRALALGQAAAASSDFDLAEVYLVNAISRLPENVKYLTEYTQVFKKRPDLKDEDVERLTSILELAIYRVSSENVKAVQDLLKEAEKLRTTVKRPQEQGPNYQEEFKRLLGQTPTASAGRAAIEKHIESLESLAAEANPTDAKLLGEISAAIARQKSVLQVLQNCDYIDKCLENLAHLEQKNELASDQAVSIVQAAENGLPLFWGQDLAALPEDVRAKVGAYPGKLQEQIAKTAKAKSEPALAKIKEFRAKASQAAGKKHEEKCKAIENQIDLARKEFAKISSPSIAEEAQKELTTMAQSLSNERKAQFNAYQLAVVDKCAVVFTNYKNSWEVSEADARAWFKDNGIAQIDQGLLSPEVARCLDDLLAKLFAELYPATLLECEKEMGTPEGKLKLENF